MKGFWPVYRKELYSIFASPIFYVVAFMFLVISGYYFFNIMDLITKISFEAMQDPALMEENFADLGLRLFFLNLDYILLLICPLLTMRLFAEERKLGTLELLFTLPVTDRATLLAKFAGSVTVFVVILLGTLPNILVLNQITDLNWLLLGCRYMGILLLACGLLSLGLFTSSLTQNQIIAAVLAFGISLIFWFIHLVKGMVGTTVGAVLGYISMSAHFDSFGKGILDSRDFIYYVLWTVLFLFLTLKRLESYRWRG